MRTLVSAMPVFLLAFANDRRIDGQYLRDLSNERKAVLGALERAVEEHVLHVEDLPNATHEEVYDRLIGRRWGDRVQLFHFAGHAGGASLMLETEGGTSAPAHVAGLASLLGSRAVQLVFLNGCATQDHAAFLLGAGVGSVIVTSEAIEDSIAAGLAARFYQGIAAGRTIRRAFEDATSAMKASCGIRRKAYHRSFVPPEDRDLEWPWQLYSAKLGDKALIGPREDSRMSRVEELNECVPESASMRADSSNVGLVSEVSSGRREADSRQRARKGPAVVEQFGGEHYESLNSPVGQEQDYRSLAEQSFVNNVNRWMGYPINAMKLSPDIELVDLCVAMPSLLKDQLDLVPEHLSFEYQIRYTMISPPLTNVRINGREVLALQTNIGRKEVQLLRQRSVSVDKPLFLAYGVSAKQSVKGLLIDIHPCEAYQWYALDLSQYFKVVPEDCEELLIPVANRLNLLSFALLWASHWVQSFYRPLTESRSSASFDLNMFTERVYANPLFHISREEVAVVCRELETSIPQMLNSLEASDIERRRITNALGFGVSLGDICMKVRSAGSLEEISTYCPESLYGTASLWLFSRSYWNFMELSARVVTPQGENGNQRWLPVRPNLGDTPRLLWVLLLCVVRLYEYLRVKVAVVRPLADDNLGQDRSVYGGNIGHLPYMSLSDAGLAWTREVLLKGDLSEHRDFFAQAQHNVVLGSQVPLSNIPALGGLADSELQPSGEPPSLLFAKESPFVKHPICLWKGVSR